MPLLKLNDIVYTANGREILSGLTLSVEPGEVYALLGTNGTGKSTLAYLIMGCEGYQPASGEIIFEGTKVNDLKIHERARIGITMAWQEPVRFEGICVSTYISIKNRVNPYPYLEKVGLAPELYLERMVDKTLSGGERKRIELASVLALEPKLAVLDEPDSGIDMLSTQDIINVITSFRERGSAVILITHREEIALIADRASQICNGRIICTGPPREVASFYKSRKCLVCEGDVCSE